MTEAQLNSLSERIIGCAFTVSNTLGAGFLEKVYENALAHELRLCGIQVESQLPMRVEYKSVVVGDYFADLLVAGEVIVEIKATKNNHDVVTAQCLNYLRISGKPLCLLINFGQSRIEVRRYRADSFRSQPE